MSLIRNTGKETGVSKKYTAQRTRLDLRLRFGGHSLLNINGALHTFFDAISGTLVSSWLVAQLKAS
jgi:hypothetical protein